jgi:hypothetical protein
MDGVSKILLLINSLFYYDKLIFSYFKFYIKDKINTCIKFKYTMS